MAYDKLNMTKVLIYAQAILYEEEGEVAIVATPYECCCNKKQHVRQRKQSKTRPTFYNYKQCCLILFIHIKKKSKKLNLNLWKQMANTFAITVIYDMIFYRCGYENLKLESIH